MRDLSTWYRLSMTMKERIWKGKFVDILSLLPSSKEFLPRADKKPDERGEDDRHRPIPRSLNNWLQAYCIFSSVFGEKHLDKCSGLFQHFDMLEAYRNIGGLGWFQYDESFRQKPSIYPS